MAEGGQDQTSGVADVMPTSLSSGTSGSAILAEGENVNLKFAKSTINVVTGVQINANKVVFNNSGAEGEATSTYQETCLALVKCINDNATRKTVDKILEDFADEDLHKPDFEVNPQMRRVSRSKYFKGDYEEVKDMEVTIVRNWFCWQKKEVVKNQFRKEFGFLRQIGDDKKFITLDEVLLQDIEKKSSITAIVASAGSGKTTLMRRITRKTLGYSLATTEAISDPSLLKYKMIHYIEIKDINDKGMIKPSKFLFGDLFPNEIAERQAYQWLLENQSEIIIFFDGLDQATWKINKKGDKNIDPFTLADASTIMYNILSRNLLSDTKIVISSREFQVSDLPAEARPADIIALSGLSVDDAQKLFVFLIGHDGNKAWERIQQMSPRLINLVSIPVFLVLTAVIMAKDPTKTPPKTVTELYKRIIYILSDVTNIRKAEDIVEIIKKLKAMAYHGMEEGRVMFYEKDLKMFGISKDEVHDLMMKVPGNKLLSRNLLEGDFIFFFCHQSLQEFLAAGFVVEMSLITFTRFVYMNLHKKRWSVVRRFVCGIIYDNSPGYLREVSSQTMKRQVLGRSIRSQLEKNQFNSRILMELYTAIYESDDDNLMKQLHFIDVSGIPLSRDQAHVVGTLVAGSQGLEWLALRSCDINDETLAVIARCLTDPVHVNEVWLWYNFFSASALRSFLGHRRSEALSGNLHWEEVWIYVGARMPLDILNIHNEGDDVITINGVGRFNIEDSSLSFEKVLFDKVKVEFLEELFGVSEEEED